MDHIIWENLEPLKTHSTELSTRRTEYSRGVVSPDMTTAFAQNVVHNTEKAFECLQ